MRIEGPSRTIGLTLLQIAAGKPGVAAFEVDQPAVPSGGQPAIVAQPATSVQMLVALASVDPAGERRRKLAAQADKGLAMLERLHADSVRGTVAPERLTDLAAWAKDFTVPDDPDLAAIARDIELRVRVELAKHDMTA